MKRVFLCFIIVNIFFIIIGCSTSQLENKNYSLVKSEAGGSSLIIEGDGVANNEKIDTITVNSIKSNLTSDVTNKASRAEDFKFGGNGKTSNKKILLRNNIIIIKHENGFVELNQENIEILKKDVNGWALREGTEFRLFDNKDVEIYGEIELDKNNADIYFKPDKKLDFENRYVMFVIADNKAHEVVLLSALDDIKESDSFFSKVSFFGLGEFDIKNLFINKSAYYGFSFIDNPVKIMFWLSGLEKGAEVYFTLYNSFNNGNNTEVYYQRWKKSGNSIIDNAWKIDELDGSLTKKIILDDEDGSLDGLYGTPDYSFSNIYIEFKIMLKDKNITSKSNAKLNVVNYYSYMKNIKKLGVTK